MLKDLQAIFKRADIRDVVEAALGAGALFVIGYLILIVTP